MKANEALARRWMASKHWGGWRVGMRCAQTLQVIICGPDPDPDHIWSQGFRIPDEGASPQPDLDHPGTRAFLREDVKRAFEKKWGGIGDSSFEVSHGGSRQEWRVEWRNLSNGGGWMLAQLGTGHTEEEALIAALESAPE